VPTNIEIKARVTDRLATEKSATAVADSGPQVIRQEDVFFRVRKGRLKLRFFGPRRGELIYYERENSAGPKPSKYIRFPTNRPKELQQALAKALGIAGIVGKTRHLYLVGNTRIHLDKVEGLGQFLELEVVLSARQTPRQGRRIAERLMKQLGVKNTELISGAYVDLLRLRRRRKDGR
jgi:predicted adenylyl cyclase CyaB